MKANLRVHLNEQGIGEIFINEEKQHEVYAMKIETRVGERYSAHLSHYLTGLDLEVSADVEHARICPACKRDWEKHRKEME